MKRKALMALGVLVCLGAVAYIAQPVGHVPPFDANLVRLAESELQGYCAGETLWRSQAQGDAELAAACRAERAGELSDAPDLAAVEGAFCRGIVEAGWGGDVPSCLEILRGRRLWPTYDGAITDQWNRARPYPQPVLAQVGSVRDDSRTGGREDAPSRGIMGPGAPAPTETTPNEATTEGTE